MSHYRINIIISYIFLMACVSSCAVKRGLPIDYFSTNKKVGILIVDHEIAIFNEGSQSTLSRILTPDDKYIEPLKIAGEKINISENIIELYDKVFQSHGIELKIVDHDFDISKLPRSKKKRSSIKYSKYDYSFLKEKYEIDEIILVDVRHGIVATKYGLLTVNMEGFCAIDTRIVNLKDNSVEYNSKRHSKVVLPSKWETPPSYNLFTTTIRSAIDNCKLEEQTFISPKREESY